MEKSILITKLARSDQFNSTQDIISGEGHGTFVAGVIAEQADADITFVPIVVTDAAGVGESKNLLKAVHAAVEHQRKRSSQSPEERAIIIASLSETMAGSWYIWLDAWTYGLFHRIVSDGTFAEACRVAANSGFLVVIAGGNSNSVAHFQGLDKDSSIFIVGASTGTSRATYSNYGPSITLFAPGHALGPSARSDSATGTRSGTSVSAPLVASSIIKLWNYYESEGRTLSAREVGSAFLRNGSLVDPSYIKNMRCPKISETCLSTTTRALVN